jgi:glutamate racemase
MADRRPIGVFDSGVGGLTVPGETSAGAGRRRSISATTAVPVRRPLRCGKVLAFSIECLDRLAERDVSKFIVVACNT